MPSVYEICGAIGEVGPNGRINPRAKIVPVTAKLGPPSPLPRKPGLYTLTPEQCLSVIIPRYSLNGLREGYQRGLHLPHARAMARAMADGREFPVGELSLEPDGTVVATDMQHRLVAAVIAGAPVRVVLTARTEDQQRKLFADQQKARRIDRTTLIVSGDSPYDLYVLDALTSPDHPWARIVAERASTTRISAPTMQTLLTTYVGLVIQAHGAGARAPIVMERFDESAADELAELVAAFGTKVTNPLAFEAYRLRSIAATAALVFRRGEPHPDDRKRWVAHMPTFNFAENVHLRRGRDLTLRLAEHWNKRLPDGSPRRIAP